MITIDSSNKFLVVDDEFGPDDEEDTLIHLEVPKELGLFAKNYDQALEILNNYPEIIICFVDFNIPKNNQQPKVDYEKKEKWLGELLIPEIRKLNSNVSIIVYSAYADQAYLQNFSEKYSDTVTAFFEKPYGLDLRKQLYLDAINKQGAVAKNSSFDTSNISEENIAIIFDRATKIKTLLKQTVQNMLGMGAYLSEVRELLPHGKYEDWLQNVVQLSSPTASRITRAYERFKSYDINDIEQIGVSVLYILADTNIPDQDVNRIIKSSQSQPITARQAEKLKKDYKKQNTLEKNKKQSKLLDAANPKLIAKSQINSPSDNSLSKQNIIQVLPLQRVWDLGANRQHKVIAADPNSEIFLRELPPKISLSLCFPPEKNWQFQFNNIDTTNIFNTNHQDYDEKIILQIVHQLISIVHKLMIGSTEEDDNVAVCYIPDPRILSLIDQLGCHAFIADPDYEKCLKLVNLFNSGKLAKSSAS
jgi:hypothetical protein